MSYGLQNNSNLHRPYEINQPETPDKGKEKVLPRNEASHSLSLREWNWNLINPWHEQDVMSALITTGAGVVTAALPWTAPKIWGATVLAGVAYGIINDLFACRVCPEYFTVGHVYDGERLNNRLVRTLDPNINAVAWGMVATTPVTTIAGAILGCAAAATGMDQQKMLITMGGLTSLTLLVADVVSRNEKAKIERNPQIIYEGVPKEFQSRWHANNVRNSIGYLALGVETAALCVFMAAFKCLG